MPRITKIKRHDTAPAFTATLQDANNDAVDISGAAVLFLMRNPRTRELKVSSAATITDAAAGRISYAWAAGDTDTPGVYQVEVQVTFGSGEVETFPNGSHHRLEVLKDLGP